MHLVGVIGEEEEEEEEEGPTRSSNFT